MRHRASRFCIIVQKVGTKGNQRIFKVCNFYLRLNGVQRYSRLYGVQRFLRLYGVQRFSQL